MKYGHDGGGQIVKNYFMTMKPDLQHHVLIMVIHGKEIVIVILTWYIQK